MINAIAFAVLFIVAFLLAQSSVRPWLDRRKRARELAFMRGQERLRQQRDAFAQEFDSLSNNIKYATTSKVNDSGCTECGGAWGRESPSSIKHSPWCPGVARASDVASMLDSFRAQQLPEDMK